MRKVTLQQRGNKTSRQNIFLIVGLSLYLFIV